MIYNYFGKYVPHHMYYATALLRLNLSPRILTANHKELWPVISNNEIL